MKISTLFLKLFLLKENYPELLIHIQDEDLSGCFEVQVVYPFDSSDFRDRLRVKQPDVNDYDYEEDCKTVDHWERIFRAMDPANDSVKASHE